MHTLHHAMTIDLQSETFYSISVENAPNFSTAFRMRAADWLGRSDGRGLSFNVCSLNDLKRNIMIRNAEEILITSFE